MIFTGPDRLAQRASSACFCRRSFRRYPGLYSIPPVLVPDPAVRAVLPTFGDFFATLRLYLP
jgi:hypothetical protein